jgi:hypothetical protein
VRAVRGAVSVLVPADATGMASAFSSAPHPSTPED